VSDRLGTPAQAPRRPSTLAVDAED
jgi:hypothetical protein